MRALHASNPKESQMPGKNDIQLAEIKLAEIVGQTLATAYIEGGEQVFIPIYDALYLPLAKTLQRANPDFESDRFAAEVDAAESSYVNAAMGDKTGARMAAKA
jgi:hypothetical protein